MGGGSGLAASASSTCSSASARGSRADAPQPDPAPPRGPRRAARLRGGALIRCGQIWPRRLSLRCLCTGKRATEGRGRGPAAARTPAAAASVDWCRLSEELLVAIMAELEVIDLVRAGAVCSSWCAAFAAFCRHPVASPKQPPCLLYSDRDDPDVAVLRAPLFSSNSAAAAPPIRAGLPGLTLSRRTFVGSAHGWLVTADEASDLHVVNPLTGAQLALPPLATLHNVESSTGEGGDPTYRIFVNTGRDPPATLAATAARETMYHRAVLSCSPSAGAACIVLLLHWHHGKLSFARLGDEHWTPVSAAEGHGPIQRSGYRDAVYNSSSGLFYMLHCDGAIYTLDLNGESPSACRIFLPSVPMGDPGYGSSITMYLVMAPSGDFLQVCRQVDINRYPVFSPPRDDGDYVLERWIETCNVWVYMLDLHEQKREQITNLGDHSLFLGYNNSMCISTKDLPMLKPNLGYLTDNCYERVYIETDSSRDMGVFRIGETPKYYQGRYRKRNLRRFPFSSECLPFPVPIWITPSLC